jgi:hypothetical protein
MGANRIPSRVFALTRRGKYWVGSSHSTIAPNHRAEIPTRLRVRMLQSATQLERYGHSIDQ